MAYSIYLFLCALCGFTTATVDVDIKKWQFWVLLFCVMGAYICGKYGCN